MRCAWHLPGGNQGNHENT